MGLFNLFKKPSPPEMPSLPDLSTFRAALAANESAKSYSDIIATCDTLLAIIPTIKESDIISTFKIEGENNQVYYYHREFGILMKGRSYLSDLTEKVQQKRNHAVFQLNKSEEYRENLEGIPLAKVEIDISAPALTRKSL